MSSDLGLDPSDPLNLILHNAVQNSDGPADETSSDASGSQDWSKFSLWATNGIEQSPNVKPYLDILDFPDLNTMDMDFNPSMSLDPSALQYDALKFGLSGLGFTYDDSMGAGGSSDLLGGQYPFTFQSVLQASSELALNPLSASPHVFVKERRLSVTSSSSSSGASFSPVPESLPSPANGYASDGGQAKDEPTMVSGRVVIDPVAELAQRVRESAGVMMAIPSNPAASKMALNPNMMQTGNPLAAKLPIPRLPRHTNSPKSASSSTTSSAASTPPPSTPPPTSAAPFKLTVNPNVGLGVDASGASTPTTANASGGSQPRPKTSHTTIERRYRTNLNARIQSLRMAVPALRVLEDRDGGNGKKIKKNLKGGVVMKGTGIGIVDNEDGTIVDVIDERGFVDGVKVARKCSKANVLGKAVEYIRVLKRREQRLKAEQAGLKSLVSGLVGGAALVREWEKEWRTKFGGEEKDEVEGEDEEGDDEDSEDEDGEDDDEVGKKRKRTKSSNTGTTKKTAEKKKPTVSPVVLLTGGVDQSGGAAPEKRKRGRPRKVLPPAVTLAPVSGASSQEMLHDSVMQDGTFSPSSSPESWIQQQSQPQQYLLAVFALFSFFNSPLTSSYSGAGHKSHAGVVLNSVPPLAYAPEIVSQFVAPAASPSQPASWAWREYVQMLHILVSCLVLVSFLGSWLGLQFFGSAKSSSRGRRSPMNASSRRSSSRETADWKGLAEECVLNGSASSLSFMDRLKIYRSTSSRRNPSIRDLTTTALALWDTPNILFRGLARRKAHAIFSTAQEYAKRSGLGLKYPVTTSEKLVLDTLSLPEAAERLNEIANQQEVDEDLHTNPISVLASVLVKERIRDHLSSLFVRVVDNGESGEQDDDDLTEKELNTSTDEEDGTDVEWRRTIDASKEVGGRTEELGKIFERVWKGRLGAEFDEAELLSDGSHESLGGLEGEIRALLTALVLYRRLLSDIRREESTMMKSTLLSPPPSPGPRPTLGEKRDQMLLVLRKVLGSRVFEDGDDAEDARDRVVDLVVACERRERGNSLPLS